MMLNRFTDPDFGGSYFHVLEAGSLDSAQTLQDLVWALALLEFINVGLDDVRSLFLFKVMDCAHYLNNFSRHSLSLCFASYCCFKDFGLSLAFIIAVSLTYGPYIIMASILTFTDHF